MTHRFARPKILASQPIDRAALVLMAVLAGVIGLLLLGGDHASPRVRDFSWQERQVGAAETAFLLTFSRPMEHASVEQNLQIEPPLPGKVSWAGRRMAYTLLNPAPYGTEYELRLQGARDRFSKAATKNPLQPFVSKFRSRDRAFIYLGVEGDEAGRLVLENLTQKTKEILTPPSLGVFDYKPYPEGDRILFSALDRNNQTQDNLNTSLYTVTTGINPRSPERSIGKGSSANPQANVSSSLSGTPPPAKIVQLVLDTADYQNLKFDLSPDGQVIAVQRVNRKNPADFGLWIVKAGEAPRPLKTDPGGDFMIAPDSASIAMAQGQGMALLPLDAAADPLDFLSKFGVVLSFASDGSAAAMVQFNRDPTNPTRSLFLVTNQGKETELLKTDGSFLSAQFDPTKTLLYVLLTKRVPGDQYIEQPFLVAVNLKTGKRTDLLVLPIQRDIQMNLAPDGLAMMFDQAVSTEDGSADEGVAQGSDGRAIATSRLWLLPLQIDAEGNPTKMQPQALGVNGLRPYWLP